MPSLKKDVKKFIPLEKSWIIRMGVLDLTNGRAQIKEFLASQQNLGDDLLALKRIVEAWDSDEILDVGESGTLYRFLLFTSWSLMLNKKFRISGTLESRNVTLDPSIINLSQEGLLRLDSGTSQWASAKVVLGDPQRLTNPPHLLAVSYEAFEHWNLRTGEGSGWQPRLDRTILSQAKAFLELIETGETNFTPAQAEDYCFARALGLIAKEEGERRWPALRNHESDRISSMEGEITRAIAGKAVQSKDHRVTQALAIWGGYKQKGHPL